MWSPELSVSIEKAGDVFSCERIGHPQDLCDNLSIADRVDQESRQCFVRQRMGRPQKSMPSSLLIPIGNPNMADRIDQESRRCVRPSKNGHYSSRSSKSMPSSSSKSYVMIWARFAVSIKKADDDLSTKEWDTRRSTWIRYHNRDIRPSEVVNVAFERHNWFR